MILFYSPISTSVISLCLYSSYISMVRTQLPGSDKLNTHHKVCTAVTWWLQCYQSTPVVLVLLFYTQNAGQNKVKLMSN